MPLRQRSTRPNRQCQQGIANKRQISAHQGVPACQATLRTKPTGPSGCGKSTLLRLIGGLEKPSSGEITQIGSPPLDCLNAMTYIFQDFALLPWRTVEENISLVLEDHSLSSEVKRSVIDDVLDRTKLKDYE